MLEYRYDTQLLIDGEGLDEDAINEYFESNFDGDCLLAVGATIQLLKIQSKIYIYRQIYFYKELPTFITSVERREIAQNSFNCWKFLKLVKLQRRIEKYSSVNVAKAEKINQMA